MPSNRSIGAALAFTGLSIGALIPLFLVIYPSLGLTQAKAGDAAAFLAVVAANPVLVIAPGLLQVVGHAIGGAAVVGLWWRYGRESYAITAASVAGVVWMAVDLIDNALSLQLVPSLASSYAAGDPSAVATMRVIQLATDALRLGGHLAGGLWIVGVSAALWRAGRLHPALGAFGLLAGGIFAANPIVPALLNVSFMTIPLWLVVFGLALARRPDAGVAMADQAGSAGPSGFAVVIDRSR